MLIRLFCPSVLLCILIFLHGALAEDEYYNADADDANDADEEYDDNNDDGDDYAGDDGDDGAANYDGDDYIKYWTEYAVLPKKCITYNNVDMIVFSMYAQASQHCMDKPEGTYMTPVPTFVEAYLDQLDSNAEEMGGDDYTTADSTFVNCYQYETNGGVYYAQLGCTDGDSQSLSVQLYSDNTCETPDKNANGDDDLAFDVDGLQVPFKECKSCVNFVNTNEDDVDDQYFENKMTNAPLCATIWAKKSVCDRKCKRLGNDDQAEGWNASDKILLSVLGVFSAVMLAVILKKRRKMSNKNALLEEAALSAAGLQQTHIIGIFVLVLLVVVVFGILGFKGITWGMLLIINAIVFGYLMKLTIDGLSSDPKIGPDGELLEDEESSDDDDDDDEEEGDEEEDNRAGEYKSPEVPSTPPLPAIPPIT